MIDYGLNGKVVIVTGANNPYGIGAKTALSFGESAAWGQMPPVRRLSFPIQTVLSVEESHPLSFRSRT